MPINQMPLAQAARAGARIAYQRLRHYALMQNIVDQALLCNVDYLKVAAMDVLDGVGCRYFLHSQVGGALMMVSASPSGGGHKEGLVDESARAVVDC